MASGGKREGSGRPLGAKQKVTNLARIEAAKEGLLPHEWLLKVARGEPVLQTFWKDVLDKRGNFVSKELVEEEVYADFPTRIDAAKAAAPFYAPRLAVQTVSVSGNSDAVSETLKSIAEKLPV